MPFIQILCHQLSFNTVTTVLELQKRKPKKIPVNIENAAGVGPIDLTKIAPGDRDDNRWLQFDPEHFISSEEEWNSVVFIEKTHWGYYTWPKLVLLFLFHLGKLVRVMLVTIIGRRITKSYVSSSSHNPGHGSFLCHDESISYLYATPFCPQQQHINVKILLPVHSLVLSFQDFLSFLLLCPPSVFLEDYFTRFSGRGKIFINLPGLPRCWFSFNKPLPWIGCQATLHVQTRQAFKVSQLRKG